MNVVGKKRKIWWKTHCWENWVWSSEWARKVISISVISVERDNFKLSVDEGTEIYIENMIENFIVITVKWKSQWNCSNFN